MGQEISVLSTVRCLLQFGQWVQSRRDLSWWLFYAAMQWQLSRNVCSSIFYAEYISCVYLSEYVINSIILIHSFICYSMWSDLWYLRRMYISTDFGNTCHCNAFMRFYDDVILWFCCLGEIVILCVCDVSYRGKDEIIKSQNRILNESQNSATTVVSNWIWVKLIYSLFFRIVSGFGSVLRSIRHIDWQIAVRFHGHIYACYAGLPRFLMVWIHIVVVHLFSVVGIRKWLCMYHAASFGLMYDFKVWFGCMLWNI